MWVLGAGLRCQTCVTNRFYTCGNCKKLKPDYTKVKLQGHVICNICESNLTCFEPKDQKGSTDIHVTQTSRLYGIELESDHDLDYRLLHLEDSLFGAKSDPTCYGREFYSPPLAGDQGLLEIERLCATAKHLNWTVDRQCGFHLHLDMRTENSESLRRIVYAWANLYPVISRCVARHRLHSEYCEDFMTAESVEQTDDLYEFFCRQDRYNYMNVQAYNQHGTFENRLHEGTFDSQAIKSWILLNLYVTEEAKQQPVSDLKAQLYQKPWKDQWRVVKSWLKDDTLSSYYEDRMAGNHLAA
jgi:hypothetical protein